MSKKFRPPTVAITSKMIEAGKLVLDAMTQGDNDNHTDDALVANIFFSMWQAYWQEIANVKAKKTPSALIVPQKSALIIPMRTKH